MALTKQARIWTYDDLLALPDDGTRYEIVEGELHEMPSPNWDHSTTVMNLITLLLPVVTAMGGLLRTAAIDVFFAGADPVQPDLLVLLPGWGGRLTQRGPEGAPDLVIEVLSPSNRAYDRLTKRALYGRAGVREYWIVDPEARTVEVLTLERDALVTAQLASGDDAVTSALLGGAAFPLTAIFAGIGEGADAD
jgi:Uma2 family endonuclease